MKRIATPLIVGCLGMLFAARKGTRRLLPLVFFALSTPLLAQLNPANFAPVPRIVVVIGATVTVDRYGTALLRVRTTTGRFLSGGAKW